MLFTCCFEHTIMFLILWKNYVYYLEGVAGRWRSYLHLPATPSFFYAPGHFTMPYDAYIIFTMPMLFLLQCRLPGSISKKAQLQD